MGRDIGGFVGHMGRKQSVVRFKNARAEHIREIRPSGFYYCGSRNVSPCDK